MINDICKFIIDENTLKEYETSINDALHSGPAGGDRLRYFLQVMMLSRACVDVLQNIDMNDMIKTLREEAEKRLENMEEMIHANIVEMQQTYSEILQKVDAKVASLQAHYECLESISKSIKPWDAEGNMSVLAAEMSDRLSMLEEGLLTLVKLRQSEEFARLCTIEKEFASQK